MSARWDRAPSAPKARKPRAKVRRGTWRCSGAQGCGELLTGTWAAAERHSDEHGGSRLECVPSGPPRQADCKQE